MTKRNSRVRLPGAFFPAETSGLPANNEMPCRKQSDDGSWWRRSRKGCWRPVEPAWHSRERQRRRSDRLVALLSSSLLRIHQHHGSALPSVLKSALACKLCSKHAAEDGASEQDEPLHDDRSLTVAEGKPQCTALQRPLHPESLAAPLDTPIIESVSELVLATSTSCQDGPPETVVALHPAPGHKKRRRKSKKARDDAEAPGVPLGHAPSATSSVTPTAPDGPLHRQQALVLAAVAERERAEAELRAALCQLPAVRQRQLEKRWAETGENPLHVRETTPDT